MRATTTPVPLPHLPLTGRALPSMAMVLLLFVPARAAAQRTGSAAIATTAQVVAAPAIRSFDVSQAIGRTASGGAVYGTRIALAGERRVNVTVALGGAVAPAEAAAEPAVQVRDDRGALRPLAQGGSAVVVIETTPPAGGVAVDLEYQVARARLLAGEPLTVTYTISYPGAP